MNNKSCINKYVVTFGIDNIWYLRDYARWFYCLDSRIILQPKRLSRMQDFSFIGGYERFQMGRSDISRNLNGGFKGNSPFQSLYAEQLMIFLAK